MNLTCPQLSFEVHCIFEILNFSTIIFIKICRPLVAKLRNQELSKMTSRVVFSAKKCAKVQFLALGIPKAEKTSGGHNNPP